MFDIWSPDSVRSAFSEPPAQPKSWSDSIRDILLSNGLYMFATPTSRLFSRVPKKICLSGLDSSGKTTLLKRHLSQNSGKDIHTIRPFIGFALEELRYGQVCFQSASVGGGRKKHIFIAESALFHISDAVIYVVDAADQERLIEAREELARVLNKDDGIKNGVPVLILANKQSINDAVPPEEMKRIFCVLTCFGDRPWHVAGTDAISGEGVYDALKWLSGLMRSKLVEEKAGAGEKLTLNEEKCEKGD